MKVELKYKSDKEYVAVNESGNAVNIDMLDPESKNHQSPTQLLLSALGACAAVDMVSMVKKRRKTFVDLKAEVTGERREEHPRAFTNIHLHYAITSPDLTEEEAERIVDLATTKYCSVAGSLSADQTHSFEIIRP
uniref:OsmC family protein n=1 Tax=Mariniflexile sp. TaxID=1979402 RepID=UPI004048D231